MRIAVDREDTAWAGGLFEGEGSIFLVNRYYYKRGVRTDNTYTLAHGSLVSTDRDTVERFYKIIGFGAFRGPFKPKTPNSKPYWRWQVSGFERTQALIAMLWPWLGQRRQSKAVEVITKGKGCQRSRAERAVVLVQCV